MFGSLPAINKPWRAQCWLILMEPATESFTPPKEAQEDNTYNWLKLFRFSLDDGEKLIFLVIISIILILAAIVNLVIVLFCCIYQTKHWNKNDLYTSSFYRKVTTALRNRFGSNLGTLVKSDDIRAICFFLLSIQPRLRYNHIMYLNVFFSLVMCGSFLPFVALQIFDYKDVDWIHDNQFLFLCQAVSLFQVNFLSFTLFVNTSIAFVSTVFPIYFSLKKTSIIVLLVGILLLCLIHMICVLILTINRLNEALFASEAVSLEDRVKSLGIALIVTVYVFIGTFACSIILFLVIFILIANSKSTLDEFEENPVTVIWKEILQDCRNKVIVLFLASIVFYGLEAPSYLSVYNLISVHWWILICHCAVHLFVPMFYFPLGSQLLHPMDMSRAQICRRVVLERPNQQNFRMADVDDESRWER